MSQVRGTTTEKFAGLVEYFERSPDSGTDDGLASSYAPVGPSACFWGGYGGSLVMMDQELGLAVSYTMNKM